MTETMSLSTRKTAVTAQIAAIGEAGGTLDAVVVNKRAYSGPAVLSRAVENMTAGELDELQPQLDREEDRLATREPLKTAQAAEDERRARLREPIQAGNLEAVEMEALSRAAAADATRDAGYATFGQLRALIAAVNEVRDELRKR